MKIDILLRAKHDKNFAKLSDFIVIIKHRGLPGNVKEIDGSDIKDVYKDYFLLKDGTYIPAHRIIEIKKKSR